MPKLLNDIFSNKKVDAKTGLKKYGSKGEEIKIISDHGNILIVQNKSGNRFSVNKNEITNE